MPKLLFQHRRTATFILEKFLIWLIFSVAQSATLDSKLLQDLIVDPNYLTVKLNELASPSRGYRTYAVPSTSYLSTGKELPVSADRPYYVLIGLPMNDELTLLDILANNNNNARWQKLSSDANVNYRKLPAKVAPNDLIFGDQPSLVALDNNNNNDRQVPWRKRSGFPLSDYTPTPCRWKLCASLTTMRF